MRKTLLLIAAIALAYFVLRLVQVEHKRRLREEAQRAATQGPIQLAPMDAMPMTVPANVLPPRPKAPSPTPSLAPPARQDALTNVEKSRLTVAPPLLANIRKEVGENPHNTPPSLLKFGGELGPKMDEAMTSESKARYLFGELEKCAVSADSAQSAQALCLQDAHRLELKYKSLHNDYDTLESKTAPEVVRLSKVLGE